ncbi:MAG: winged helix-turn-helix domain-containing protein [Acetobacteraceae bacterium]|nr:winged helix-turn-helix domain-containing protein [Acetobacteraceae bacterium]
MESGSLDSPTRICRIRCAILVGRTSDCADTTSNPRNDSAFSTSCQFASFSLDMERGTLAAPDGRIIPLRPKSAELLWHLAEHAGRVVSRDALMVAVWPNVFVTDDNITQCVTEIRRALGVTGAQLLRTLPKRGYVLDAEVTRRNSHAKPASVSSELAQLTVNVIQPGIVSHRGRFTKTTHGSFVACFDSCTDALQCSMRLQQNVASAEVGSIPERRIRLRLGLHFGEVSLADEGVFGQVVEIAERLCECAEPGAILLAGAVQAEIGSRFELKANDLGELRLPDIDHPLRAFQLRLPADTHAAHGALPFGQPRRAEVPAVAVLPFRDLDVPAGQSHMGDGILEEIALRLATLREVAVISPTSTLRYRDAVPDISRVAQDFGARYVISGSIQRSGPRLRIRVLLSDAETAGIVWSNIYEGDPERIFDLQDQITFDILATVAPQIREAELRRARSKPPENLGAYDYFLRGVELLRGKDIEEFDRAHVMFKKAMQADEYYAPTYAYAAFWHIRNIAQGWSSDPGLDVRQAMALSALAIEHEPSNALGLAIHAHCRSFILHDYESALPLHKRAVARSPNHAFVLSFSSLTHSYVEDSAEALAEAERSVRLSPHDLYSFWLYMVLAVAHYANRNFEEAAVWSKRAFHENRHFSANLRTLAASLSAVGRFEEARGVGAILMRTDPAFRVSQYALLCPWAVPHTKEEFLSNLKLAGLPE